MNRKLSFGGCQWGLTTTNIKNMILLEWIPKLGLKIRLVGGAGGVVLCKQHFVLGVGSGYTASKIDWRHDCGRARIHSVFVTPAFGLVYKHGFVSLSLMGSKTTYHATREIRSPLMVKTAKNKHISWDFLVKLDGEMGKDPKEMPLGIGVIPYVSISYMSIYEGSYTEYGALPVNLHVKKRHFPILRPEIKVNLQKETLIGSTSIITNTYAGWHQDIFLDCLKYTAYFEEAKNCSKRFTVKVNRKSEERFSFGLNTTLFYQNTVYKNTVFIKFAYECNTSSESVCHRAWATATLSF